MSADTLEAPPADVEDAVRAWMVHQVAVPAAELGRPGAVCPYLASALAKQLVLVRSRRWGQPDPVAAVADLVHDSLRWYRSASWPGGPAHLRSTVAVFTGMPRSQWPVIDTVQASLKGYAVARGLMVGQFHPDCETGSIHNLDLPVLRSPYPLVVVRAMARHDLYFLHHNRTWFHAYARQFGHLHDDGAGNVQLARLYREAIARWGEPACEDTEDQAAAEEALV